MIGKLDIHYNLMTKQLNNRKTITTKDCILKHFTQQLISVVTKFHSTKSLNIILYTYVALYLYIFISQIYRVMNKDGTQNNL